MIIGMAHAFYLVSDLDRSITFYHDVLGLKIKRREEKWVEFDLGETTLALRQVRGRLWATNRGGAEVSLLVDDIAHTLRNLRLSGVSTLGALEERPQGWTVPLDDPDGNRLYLVEPSRVPAHSGTY
jgi:lactoylglutathione lyase